jgi:hypothetical protein
MQLAEAFLAFCAMRTLRATRATALDLDGGAPFR